jgi:hypothetical protein
MEEWNSVPVLFCPTELSSALPFPSSFVYNPKFLLATCFQARFLLANFSTLKMEAICPSETSGSLRTTHHYNAEDRTLHIKYVCINNTLCKSGFC